MYSTPSTRNFFITASCRLSPPRSVAALPWRTAPIYSTCGGWRSSRGKAISFSCGWEETSNDAKTWQPDTSAGLGSAADLVLVFGSSRLLQALNMDQVRARYPKALIAGCSTAGEICQDEVHDDTLVLTAVDFEHTTLRGAHIRMSEGVDSRVAADNSAKNLRRTGSCTCSSSPTAFGKRQRAGRRAHRSVAADVSVTGGLSGDGARFKATWVLADGRRSRAPWRRSAFTEALCASAFGSLGGWDPFGPERRVTRSKGNVLYELDGKSALELYKRYLGDHASGLPATGLLFPLLRPDIARGSRRRAHDPRHR